MTPLRWILALGVTLAVHVLLGVVALNWRSPVVAVPPPLAALQIELAPLPVVVTPPVVVPQPQPPAPTVIPEVAKPKLVVQQPKPKAKPAPAKPRTEPTPPAPEPQTAQKAAAPIKAEINHNARKEAKLTWQNRLLSHLARFKRYPEDARRRGLHGINSLRLVIDRNGTLVAYSLASASGSASLDRATLQLIRRAQPLPAPPAELFDGSQLEVIAPISYSIQRN